MGGEKPPQTPAPPKTNGKIPSRWVGKGNKRIGTRRIDEHAPGGVIGQGVPCLRFLLLCRSPLRFTEDFLSAQIPSLFPQAFSRIADELPPRSVGVNFQVGVGTSSTITPLLLILLSRSIGVICLTPRFSRQV